MNRQLIRPQPDEYPRYYETYVRQAPEGEILDLLEKQVQETRALLAPLSEERALHRYAPGKWSIKEILGHLIDSERVFAYRALRFCRQDPTPLPGFDQDAFVARAGFDRRSLPDLLEEFAVVRAASLSLFRTWDEADVLRRGTANNGKFTARAMPYIVLGHERHHLSVIRERYA